MFNLPRGSLFALMLILAGGLLFLGNLGFLPLGDIRAYWPVWIIFWGVIVMDKAKSAVGNIWAIALISSGILLILGNLHILTINGSILWPVMLIAFGVNMLIRPAQLQDWPERMRIAAEARRRARRSRSTWSCGPTRTFTGNTLNEAIVFSSVNRRVETQQFEGGKLDVVFGSIGIDLTGASITSPQRVAYIKANAVFGGIEIMVPRTWKVDMRSAAVFGGCDDSTVPPRPEPGFAPVTLIITGGAVFGGISIRN